MLEVRKLNKHFPILGGILLRQIGTVYAVNDINFNLPAGQTLGVVGESGCGKTTLARTISQLYRPTSGEVFFEGKEIGQLSNRERRKLSQDIQIIFQDPFESLNQRHTIEKILLEPYIIHGKGSAVQRKQWVTELVEQVGLSPEILQRFPHEFSGGQRQRIGIARAVALKPKLVICDEPVSALDVSVQSQILNLLLSLQQKLGLTYLFIAHDLSVVKHMSDQIAVMYLGHIVEHAPAATLYKQPMHPYTQALISAIPTVERGVKSEKIMLSGEVPSPSSPPSGCVFRTRCRYAKEVCASKRPELLTVVESKDHKVSCFQQTNPDLFVSG